MPGIFIARSLAALLLATSPFAVGDADHVVEPGDTLSGIAARYDASVSDLVKANNIDNPDLIRSGTTLAIPQAGGGTIVHVVQPGDTLAEIAARYGSSISAIAEANGISNIDLIRAGVSLSVTSSAGSTPSNPPTSGESGLSSPTSDSPMPPSNEEVVVGGSRTYEVKAGDTLSEIAASFGVSLRSIIDRNGISDPTLIRAGQKLQVPGGFVCPVPGAWFHNDWGAWRSGGRAHAGTDVYAPSGTPVYAPVSGRVEQINGTRGGIQFWLYGDDGVRYIGSHMSSFGAGGRVEAGAILGHIGTTGNAKGTSPHLHFEIAVDGFTVNPYYTLRAHDC